MSFFPVLGLLVWCLFGWAYHPVWSGPNEIIQLTLSWRLVMMATLRPPWEKTKAVQLSKIQNNVFGGCMWEARSRPGCQGPQRKYAGYLSTTIRKLKLSDSRNSRVIREMIRKEMKWMEKSKRSESNAHRTHETWRWPWNERRLKLEPQCACI